MPACLKGVVICLCCAFFLHARANTLQDTSGSFTTRPTLARQPGAAGFILPAVLTAYGASSFYVTAVRELDLSIRDRIISGAPRFHTNAETYFLFIPVAMVYGLNLAVYPGRNAFLDRSLMLGMSACFGGVADFTLKHLVHRLDPTGSNPASFPSGHAIAAFAGAEFLAQEFGDRSPAFSVFGYVVAAGAGVFRLYNRNHWLSDVAAGAGIGIASTKLAYLLYPLLKRHNGAYQSLSATQGTSKRPLFYCPALSLCRINGAPCLSFAAGIR